jgi:hypothetical protein
MSYLIPVVVILGIIIAFLAVLGGKDRYAEMTEEQFEEEAKKDSMLGAGTLDLQKVFQSNRVKQFVEEKYRVKQEVSAQGDLPHDLPDLPEEEEPAQDSGSQYSGTDKEK